MGTIHLPDLKWVMNLAFENDQKHKTWSTYLQI